MLKKRGLRFRILYPSWVFQTLLNRTKKTSCFCAILQDANCTLTKAKNPHRNGNFCGDKYLVRADCNINCGIIQHGSIHGIACNILCDDIRISTG